MKQARLPCLLIGSAGRNPSGVHRKARRDPPDHEDGHRRARVSNGPSSGRLWVAKTPSGVKLLAFPRLSEGEREVRPLLCPACGGRRGTSSSTRLRPSIPPRPNQSPCSCSTSPCPTRTTTEGAGPAALPDSLSLSATSSRPSEHPCVTIHHPPVDHDSISDL